MNILSLNDLALELVARDYSPRKADEAFKPNNVGPTGTSRALAIIHLAAHDAYARVTEAFVPRLETLPVRPQGLDSGDAAGTIALLSAGVRAAELLYPDFKDFITEVVNGGSKTLSGDSLNIVLNTNLVAYTYGRSVGELWVNARKNDNSDLPQLDKFYSDAVGRHRSDPTNSTQATLGRNWGQVKPFVLNNVKVDAFLKAPPLLNSAEYATAFDKVAVFGRNNTPQGSSEFREKAKIGIFWGYDGSNMLGTPPRLYNQVVRAVLDKNMTPISHVLQIKILTAINVAMADAGIAAWYWKYEYDFWRPVVGIREADKGWGPSGDGDGNTLRVKGGNPFWLPLGAPQSNPVRPPTNNFTPNFPAYPSGHSTFGSACFETLAALLGQSPSSIMFDFVSDEFNGKTKDNTGATRPKRKETFSLQTAIEANGISRIYLGVHWDFDASGGKMVGDAVASKVIAAFR